MKESIFKAVSVMLTLVLILSMLMGCGNAQQAGEDTGNTSQAATTQAATAQEVTAKEPDTIKILMHGDIAGYDTNNFTINYIEEKTNTKWDVSVVPNDQLNDKVSVLMASGEVLDLFEYTDKTIYEEFASAGVLVPINKYFDKAPNLYKSREGTIWDISRHADGNNYFVPIKTVKNVCATQYRKDWLDKFQLGVPKTLDEYYNFANLIANNDPNENGKKDTYAFGGPKWINMVDHIYSAFGILRCQWMLKDGKVVYSMIQPEAKEAVKFLNKLYKAGAIDPEFITDGEDRVKEKWASGIYGALSYYNFVLDTNNLYDFYKPFKDANPNAEWVMGDILTGSGKTCGYTSLPLTGWIKTSINSKSEKVDACLRVLDWIASEEGVMFANYGLKGEHYDLTADGVVTVKIDNAKKTELGIGSVLMSSEQLIRTTSAEYQKIQKKCDDMSQPDITEGWMLPEGFVDKSNERNDAMLSLYAKMIIGELPIDEGFDKWVQTFNQLNGEQDTEMYNKIYLERASK